MTMDDAEDGVLSMETLVQELASSRLDAASPSRRLRTIREATERITEKENDRSVLVSLRGEYFPPSIYGTRKLYGAPR
jgi:hypothetical protein